jgi:hypothetical protein
MTEPVVTSKDPFSEVVDERRRWNPEWYTWVDEVTVAINKIAVLRADLEAAKARITALGG